MMCGEHADHACVHAGNAKAHSIRCSAFTGSPFTFSTVFLLCKRSADSRDLSLNADRVNTVEMPVL